MGNKMSKAESKVLGGSVGGTTTAATVGTAIPLMIFGGPIGMVAGGVLLGAGISSGVSTVQQCIKDDNFSFGQWGISVGIGSLGGAVAAPVSAAGGAVAGMMTGTIAKVGTVVAFETAGGAMSGTATTVAGKIAAGDKLTLGDVGKGVLVGGMSGALGAGLGQASSKVVSMGAKTVGKVASSGQTALRITGGAAAGSASGAGVSALATVVDNAFHHGEFRHDKFIKTLTSSGASMETAEELWKELCKHGIVVDEKVKEQLPDSFHFSADLEPYRDAVKELIKDSLSLVKGMGSAVATGAISGGVTGAVSATVKTRQQRKQIRKDARIRAEKVKHGARGGSIEAEAFARQNNKRVVIHHDDGSVTKHGSKSATSEVHVQFDSESKHYSPADASGKKLPSASHHAGDCLFEAMSPGENPTKVRQKVSKFMSENPQKLKGVKVKELHQGGNFVGGGLRRRVQKIERTKALDAISDCPDITDASVKSRLRESARSGLDVLESKPDRSFSKIVSDGPTKTPTAKKSRYCIHPLKGDLEGHIAMDVYDTDHDHGNRGQHRLVFKLKRQNEVEFVKFLPNHDYSSI